MFTVMTCPSGTSLSGTVGMTQISNPGGQHTGIFAVRRMPVSPLTRYGRRRYPVSPRCTYSAPHWYAGKGATMENFTSLVRRPST